MEFRGAYTALVTPFKNGEVDEAAYRDLVEWQISEGIHGLVPCGTTGEAATMTHREQGEVISICVDQVKGRVPVIAGAGSNNTKEAVELTQLAKDAGADAALLISPYYNKPTPKGLVAHFKAISDSVDIPFVIYNVPGRTGLNMLPPTVCMIKNEVKNAIGIKEATGDLKQVSEVVEECGPDFTVLSGDDFTVLPLMAAGGHGAISVVSNIAPKMASDMCDAWFARDNAKAQELHIKLQGLSRALFFETNPIPVKTSLSLMGKLTLGFRLPMVEMEEENLERLKEVLKEYSLI